MKKVTSGCVVASENIQYTHVFQNAMAQSEELREILETVSRKAKIDLLEGYCLESERKDLKRICQDSAKLLHPQDGKKLSSQELYQEMSLETRKACARTFYDWHEYDLDTIIPQEKLKAAGQYGRIDGIVETVNKDADTTDFEVLTYQGSGYMLGVVNELYTGHIKEGDKISAITVFQSDLRHTLLYKYDEKTGQDMLIYNAYDPFTKDRTLKDIVETTKQVLAKSSSKNGHGDGR